MTLKVNTTTNKIELIGKADGVSFAHAMEFATATKDDILTGLRAALGERETYSLIDIHGNFVGFNFCRIKTFSVKVVEIFELYNSPADE